MRVKKYDYSRILYSNESHTYSVTIHLIYILLRLGGLEPPQEILLEPKSSASTNSATTVLALA